MTNKQPFIFIVGLLQLLSGLGMFAMIIWSIFKFGSLPQSPDILKVSPIVIVIQFVFLASLMTAAGIGLLLKKRWGWTLMLLYLAYFILRSINALFFIPSLIETLGPIDSHELSQQYVKHGGRIILGGLLIFYFYRDKVLASFKISLHSKLKSLAGFASMAFFIFLGMSALSRVL